MAEIYNLPVDLPLPDKCDHPGCDCDGTLYVMARCHSSTPLWVELSGDVLTLACGECGTVVQRYRVTGVVP